MHRLDGNMVASNKNLRGSDDALPKDNAFADVRRMGRLRAIATITFSRSMLAIDQYAETASGKRDYFS
jgi:hypothetical protein